MLRILGSKRTLCSGLSRREMLRVGGLGLAGMTLPDLLRGYRPRQPVCDAVSSGEEPACGIAVVEEFCGAVNGEGGRGLQIAN